MATAATAPSAIQSPRLLEGLTGAVGSIRWKLSLAAAGAPFGAAGGAAFGVAAGTTVLSALRKAAAVWKRRAGSFVTDSRMMSFSVCGNFGSSAIGGVGVFCRWADMMENWLSPSNG